MTQPVSRQITHNICSMERVNILRDSAEIVSQEEQKY